MPKYICPNYRYVLYIVGLDCSVKIVVRSWRLIWLSSFLCYGVHAGCPAGSYLSCQSACTPTSSQCQCQSAEEYVGMNAGDIAFVATVAGAAMMGRSLNNSSPTLEGEAHLRCSSWCYASCVCTSVANCSCYCPGGMCGCDLNDGSRCLPCEAGKFSNTATCGCPPCSPGTFSGPSSSFCTHCDYGSDSMPGYSACLQTSKGGQINIAKSTFLFVSIFFQNILLHRW